MKKSNSIFKIFFILSIFFILPLKNSISYPIDGYNKTRIARLLYLERQLEAGEELRRVPAGALFDENTIDLNLCERRDDSLSVVMNVDKAFDQKIRSIIPGSGYSTAILDMTDIDNLRYAEHRGQVGYQPGSVGKLAVLTALFTQLEKLYPSSFDDRVELLRDKIVTARYWGTGDHHTIPIYDIEKDKLTKRRVVASDAFSLYEWADHMVSVSNNGAASVLWREAMLMYAFQEEYKCMMEEDAEAFFENTSRDSLTNLANYIVNQPLLDMGITKDEWRLGSFFTGAANKYVGDKGGSTGTPAGLMKFFVQLEQGNVVDQLSSIEMKKLLYITDRRIRYAQSPSIKESGVYFKSGSFYKCDRTADPNCAAYAGNVYNYMNSVIIVEKPSGHKYIVCLMTNVLNKNSAGAHMYLAGKIDDIISGD